MKDPVFTPAESTDRRSSIVDEEDREREDFSTERQRRNENKIHNYNERPIREKDYINLVGEYQDHEGEDNEEKENYEHINKRGLLFYKFENLKIMYREL